MYKKLCFNEVLICTFICKFMHQNNKIQTYKRPRFNSNKNNNSNNHNYYNNKELSGMRRIKLSRTLRYKLSDKTQGFVQLRAFFQFQVHFHFHFVVCWHSKIFQIAIFSCLLRLCQLFWLSNQKHEGYSDWYRRNNFKEPRKEAQYTED